MVQKNTNGETNGRTHSLRSTVYDRNCGHVVIIALYSGVNVTNISERDTWCSQEWGTEV